MCGSIGVMYHHQQSCPPPYWESDEFSVNTALSNTLQQAPDIFISTRAPLNYRWNLGVADISTYKTRQPTRVISCLSLCVYGISKGAHVLCLLSFRLSLRNIVRTDSQQIHLFVNISCHRISSVKFSVFGRVFFFSAKRIT